mgnify:CR=1 FL=1
MSEGLVARPPRPGTEEGLSMPCLSCGHRLHALASFRFAVSLTQAEEFCYSCGNWILHLFRQAGLSPVSERYYR